MIKQQPGETLQKYIQCFNNTRLKIPKVTDEAIISMFSNGVLSLLELPTAGAEEKKAKAKDVKRKEAAVLAAEPDTKRGRDQPESSKNSRPFYAFHNLNTHNTSDCQELRAIWEGRFGRRPERNDRGYGLGGGRWDDHGSRQEWRDRPCEGRWQDQPREGA